MTPSTQKILEDALSLPEKEREALIDALNQSLESQDADELSPEWKAEVKRRIEAIERGESELLPWDEVEERVRRTLDRG